MILLSLLFCLPLGPNPDGPPGNPPAAVAALWHEDGRNPATTRDFRPKIVEMARAAKLANADLICVLRPDVTVRLWREWRTTIEAETGVRLVPGLKMDAVCMNEPYRPEAWALARDCSRELWELGADRIVLGFEACFCYEGMRCWWIEPDRPWDVAKLRSLIGTLPAGPTYVVYPAFITGWGKCTQAMARLAETRSRQWRETWSSVHPRVVFSAAGLSGRKSIPTDAEQRLLNAVLAERCTVAQTLHICPVEQGTWVNPSTAAVLLHAASGLPQQTILYACEVHGGASAILSQVQAELKRLEAGAP